MPDNDTSTDETPNLGVGNIVAQLSANVAKAKDVLAAKRAERDQLNAEIKVLADEVEQGERLLRASQPRKRAAKKAAARKAAPEPAAPPAEPQGGVEAPAFTPE